MGAAGLIEIKRRIKSVQSTRKITNAMGLVATSKLRNSRKELKVNSNYVVSVEKIFNDLLGSLPDYYNSTILQGNKEAKKVLYVVIGSDTGLCGSYNGAVVSYLGQRLAQEQTSEMEPLIIGVGGKVVPLLKRANYEPADSYVDIGDVPSFKEVQLVTDKILSMYFEELVKEVYIVYTNFTSPARQEVKAEKLLPISSQSVDRKESMIEPDFDTVFKDALELYIQGKFRDILLNAKCSEQSARMSAMDTATQNANDLIDSLNMKYNRIRQGMITQEISEIVGGAEAQK